MRRRSMTLRPLALAALMLLAGCTTVAPDGGFDAVSDMAKARIGQQPRVARSDADKAAVADAVAAMLKQPLGADGAVRIALLNNPGLQATYWNVGIAQADLAQASRLPNPSIGFKRIEGGGIIEIERSVTLGLVALLTTPLAARIEGRHFEQAKLAVAAEIERHAAETRSAWVEAVAARQGVDYARRVNQAAEAAAQLSERMAQAGNISQLDLARDQAFYAESSAAVVRAGRAALAARERLTRLMGLWGDNAATYQLPDRLPDLPSVPAELENIERIAISQRLDIQSARQEAAATAAALGLTRATRVINVLDLGYASKSETGESAASGYEISLEVPLFDWGGARVAKAEAIYMQALNKIAQAATNARSEAREAYLDYRAAYDLARHYRDEVIPLRKKISEETLLRYNGMLASTAELLADSREQAAAVKDYIDALEDFWMAHARLEATLGGRTGAHDMTKEHHK